MLAAGGKEEILEEVLAMLMPKFETLKELINLNIHLLFKLRLSMDPAWLDVLLDLEEYYVYL